MDTYTLKNLDCADCARKIEDGLRKQPYVRSVSVDFATLSMRIESDDMPRVVAQVRSLEPGVEVHKAGGESPSEGRTDKGQFDLVRELVLLGVGVVLVILGVVFEQRLHELPMRWVEYAVFGAAYLLAGWNVLASAFRSIIHGRVFNENFLMTVATGGAFAVHQLSEAVGVMIFYKVGEILQELAVGRSRRSIRTLLDLRPGVARVRRNGGYVEVKPEEVAVGEEIAVRPGEKVPLDGVVLSGVGFLDTSALTGEPVPRRAEPGHEVLAGFLSSDASLAVRVTRPAGESSATRIIALVEKASHAKAKTEQFITRFARYYTPAVVGAALLVACVPPLILGGEFRTWVVRALTMLVISCPCALVISIPLGYFGGVGGAARRGILVKGAVFLDALAAVKTVVFDKTGTLTRGVFRVLSVQPSGGMSAESVLEHAALAEAHSNHPIAASIRQAFGGDGALVTDVRETGGLGVTATVRGKSVVVGNDRMLHREGIEHGQCVTDGTTVHVAVDGTYAGFISIGDELQPGAADTVHDLRGLGVERVVLLTGDSVESAKRTADALGIAEYSGDLLPAGKLARLESIMAHQGRSARTAFVGDGINDAPVLARADVGIAMGGSGSDAAVESADVVLMTDAPSKVAEAVRRARATRAIVVQNIVFALAVKGVFLALGAFGIATMWEAVIADMGVALAAILNATRAMR
jgi:Zn2+/Cd2+-exporting ATPase